MTFRFLMLLCFAAITTALTAQTLQSHQTEILNKPTVAWKFKTKAPIFGSPVASKDAVFVGGLDSVMYALQLATGKLLWTFKTGGEIRSTVCLSDTDLFFYSGDATMYCLDKSTGMLKWKFRTKGGLLGDRRHDFADYFQSSPVLKDDRLFFGGGDGRLYALAVADGSLLWVFKTNGIIHTTPALDETRVYAGSFDGHLYALDQRDGRLCWKFKTVGHVYFPDGEVQGSPVVANGTVYAGARDYNLYAIDAAEGYCRWNKKFPSGWALALTPNDSVIYVGTSDDRVLAALDSNTGLEIWRSDVKFNIFGPCSFTASMAYVGTLMGKVFGIDLRDGKIKWSLTTDSHSAQRRKYFLADDVFRDDIIKIIKTPVDFIAMEYALGAIFSTPAIADNRLIVSSTDGTLYCFQE